VIQCWYAQTTPSHSSLKWTHRSTHVGQCSLKGMKKEETNPLVTFPKL
jgi:hypothetical protein